jgi:hypothetical protein
VSEACITPVDRSAEREPFNPVKVSPSRVDKYLGCGVQFKRQYIDREKAQLSGSAALFGNIMHGALEKWALNRSQDLVTLTAQAWIELTRHAPVVAQFIAEYQAISVDVMKAEKAAAEAFLAKNKRETKAARMTKHFKESDAARKLNALVIAWLPKLNAESPWRFTERDPLPSLYDESLILAKRYARRNEHLPAALHTEFGFNVPWEGFLLNGYIDVIEPIITPDGELRGYGVVDYKSYRAEPAGAKDHRQGTFYDIAFEYLVNTGQLPFDPELPVWIIFDYLRLGTRVDYSLGQADRDVLLADLQMYRKGVEAEVFLPAQKGGNPDFCDYPDCCLRSRGEGTGERGGLYPVEA